MGKEMAACILNVSAMMMLMPSSLSARPSVRSPACLYAHMCRCAIIQRSKRKCVHFKSKTLVYIQAL